MCDNRHGLCLMSFFHAGGGGDLLFKIYSSFYFVVYNLFLNKKHRALFSETQTDSSLDCFN